MAKQQQRQFGEEELCGALKYHFQHDTFRPFQLEAIQATLSGRDSLLILPTGGGKSMTFQLPALAKSNCFTVVVGPLMALAKDQV
jgi:superfamily II DNA helicase RecQ